jgi:hypothetical protein
VERLKTYAGLLQNGLPLDEAAFLRHQNPQPVLEAPLAETEPTTNEPEPEEEPGLATVSHTTGWFGW